MENDGSIMFMLAGGFYRSEEEQEQIASLVPGESAVDLIPEPDNEHDPNAIAVYFEGTHLGYVPKEHNKGLGDIMAGKPGRADVNHFSDRLVPVMEYIWEDFGVLAG